MSEGAKYILVSISQVKRGFSVNIVWHVDSSNILFLWKDLREKTKFKFDPFLSDMSPKKSFNRYLLKRFLNDFDCSTFHHCLEHINCHVMSANDMKFDFIFLPVRIVTHGTSKKSKFESFWFLGCLGFLGFLVKSKRYR